MDSNCALPEYYASTRIMNRFRAYMLGILVIIGALLMALAGGFGVFLLTIPTERNMPPPADGIVVLTGGASRIADALTLLDRGRAKRLLITGVNPATSRGAISSQVPRHDELFACCVDIGHEAANTIGNALEAQNWLRSLQFRSMIMVTSNYHMPRSLAEFARAMPDIEITPYPVITAHFRNEPWWTYPRTLRLIFSEYVKYLAASARHMVDGPPAHDAPARPLTGL